MELLKGLNLAVAFVLEICMLIVFGWWGFQTGQTPLTQILLGIGAPLLTIAIWGAFMAPRSTRRLRGAAYWGVKVVLYSLVVLALLSLSQPGLAALFAAAAVISSVLIIVWHQNR